MHLNFRKKKKRLIHNWVVYSCYHCLIQTIRLKNSSISNKQSRFLFEIARRKNSTLTGHFIWSSIASAVLATAATTAAGAATGAHLILVAMLWWMTESGATYGIERNCKFNHFIRFLMETWNSMRSLIVTLLLWLTAWSTRLEVVRIICSCLGNMSLLTSTFASYHQQKISSLLLNSFWIFDK